MFSYSESLHFIPSHRSHRLHFPHIFLESTVSMALTLSIRAWQPQNHIHSKLLTWSIIRYILFLIAQLQLKKRKPTKSVFHIQKPLHITISNFFTNDTPLSTLHEVFYFWSVDLWCFKYKIFKASWQLSEVPGSYFMYSEIFFICCIENLSQLFARLSK